MLPVIERFVKQHDLRDFVVVADSGLMTESNLLELERLGYKYIIGARIKNESRDVVNWILSQPKIDKVMQEHIKGNGRKLLIGYTDVRAKKDAYNRQKGLRRLEKAYKRGTITKDQINKRGYNKFLEISNNVEIKIDYSKVEKDAAWDGLKGYITNTDLLKEKVYNAYHNLWQVERSFRIAKSKIEIRPIFHFTRNRIEAHISICFVALKMYKELEHVLKITDIKMSVDKVLNMVKSITTIEITLPKSNKIISKTMIMQRHKRIERLFFDDFWGTQ